MGELRLGYKLMSEEHPPGGLVSNAVAAEAAGFDFAAISDHFLPWLDEQGHSPFAWAVLGAIAQSTERLGLMTAVTCPAPRYHPAVIAQAAATMSLLSRGRFTLGLGSGERLNEHVVGEGWPGIAERHERFAESVDVIQGLLSAEIRNYRGKHIVLDNAKLFDLPDTKPDVIVAAAGPKAIKIAASRADGIIATEAKISLVEQYEEHGGNGPRYAEVALCFSETEDDGAETVHRLFRWSALGWPVQAELPDPKAFASASQWVRKEDVSRLVSCGPSVEMHAKAIKKYVDAGFDHIIIVQVGPHQNALFERFDDLKAALTGT